MSATCPRRRHDLRALCATAPLLAALAVLAATAIPALMLTGCAASPGNGQAAQPPVQEDFAVAVLSAAEAERRWKHDPADQLTAIWHARHLGYAGEHAKAIAVLTQSMVHHPQHPRLLRHRGHRYISSRQYMNAISDLSLAAQRIAGTADEVEPDGRPNAAGIPRSTLHTNILYHLGMAQYLSGAFPAAADAFARALEASPNDDMRVASAYWLTLCIIQMDRHDDARRVAGVFSDPEMEILENRSYHRLLGLIAGRIPYDAITSNLSADDWTSAVTELYGIGMWHVLHGRTDEAVEVFRAITSGPVSSAFGRLAAEVEAGRVLPALE